MYNLIRSRRCNDLSFQMCLIVPNLAVARLILRWTSTIKVYNKYPGIGCVIDKIVKFMILFTTIYLKYSVNVFFHCLDHLSSFLIPTSHEFFVMDYQMDHQTSYG